MRSGFLRILDFIFVMNITSDNAAVQTQSDVPPFFVLFRKTHTFKFMPVKDFWSSYFRLFM